MILRLLRLEKTSILRGLKNKVQQLEREVGQKKVDGVKCLYFTHLTFLREVLPTVMQPPDLLKNNRVPKAEALMQKLGNAN